MKKGIAFRKLGRTSEHRWAMLRNQVTSLIEHERICTTTPKAKELRRVADQMVTLAKTGTVASRQRAGAVVRSGQMVRKLFEELGPRYRERNGGYTRIVKLHHRKGDAADMCMIEYVDRDGELRPARPVGNSIAANHLLSQAQ